MLSKGHRFAMTGLRSEEKRQKRMRMYAEKYSRSLWQRGLKSSPEDGLKLVFKGKEGVCLLNPTWELVPQKKTLIAKGASANSRSTTSNWDLWAQMCTCAI